MGLYTLVKLVGGTGTAGTTGITFNGGKSQVNPDFIQAGGIFPFTNTFLANQGWANSSDDSLVDPSTLDTDGYPTSLPSGPIYTVFFIPTQAEKPGDYTLTFNSSVNGATVVVSGVASCTAVGTGLQTFNLSAASFSALNSTTYSYNGNITICRIQVVISALGVTDIQMFHVNDAAAHTSALARGLTWGGISPYFLAELRRAKIGVIRFLNWQFGVSGADTVWANRKPTTYYTFYGRHSKPSLTCGSTAGSGDTFTITGNGTGVPASGAPTDKMTLIVKLNHSGSTTANALSLNGTTAVPFLASSSSQATTVSSGWCCIIYDSILNGWLVYPTMNGIENGCPPEVMTELCYEVGAHPYFTAPTLAFGANTDYMTSLASYIKTTYHDSGSATWMIPRFEGPNEAWNGQPARYAEQIAIKWWTYNNGGSVGGGDCNWYGYWLTKMGQAINAVWGSPDPKVQTKYQLIAGVQSAGFGPGTQFQDAVLNNVRANSSISVTFTGGGSANITAVGNGLALNAPVQFHSPSMPTGLSDNTTYYVKTTGNTFTVAATPGGVALTFSTAGSGVVMFNATSDPSYNWATTVCCTNYSNPGKFNAAGVQIGQGRADEYLSAVDYYLTYAGNPTSQATTLANYIDLNDVNDADFNGTISGTTLTINSLTRGIIQTGAINGTLVGVGVTYGTYIVGNIAGGSGAGSTWTVSASQTVGPVAIKQEGLLASYQGWSTWGRKFSNPVSKLCNYEGGWSPDYLSILGNSLSVPVLTATKTNPCVLTIATSSTNYYGGSGRPNIQTYPSGAWGNSWIQFVDFTGSWATLNGFYKITAATDTTITIALDASAMPSNFTTTLNGYICLNASSGTVTIASGTMTVSGFSGDPIVIGTTVVCASAPFGGANGYPKVSAFGSGTGGNGTYTVSNSGFSATAEAGTFLLEPWWVVNTLRFKTKSSPALTAMTLQNYADMTTNTLGGEFPSCFVLGNSNIWGVADPDIYNLDNDPQWQAIVQYNNS